MDENTNGISHGNKNINGSSPPICIKCNSWTDQGNKSYNWLSNIILLFLEKVCLGEIFEYFPPTVKVPSQGLL
jgi:hypothetical protein